MRNLELFPLPRRHSVLDGICVSLGAMIKAVFFAIFDNDDGLAPVTLYPYLLS